jgi:hypothetical protein
MLKWEKPLRQRAKSEGKGLYAYRCDHDQGLWEQVGMMDHAMARHLFLFITLVYRGKTPAEAFAEVKWTDRATTDNLTS